MPRIVGRMEPMSIHFHGSSSPQSIRIGSGQCDRVLAVSRIYLNIQRAPLCQTVRAKSSEGSATCKRSESQPTHHAFPDQTLTHLSSIDSKNNAGCFIGAYSEPASAQITQSSAWATLGCITAQILSGLLWLTSSKGKLQCHLQNSSVACRSDLPEA